MTDITTDTLLHEATLEDILDELDRRSDGEGAMVAHYGVEKHSGRGFTYKIRGCHARMLGWLTVMGDDIRKGFMDPQEIEEDD